MFLGPTLVSIYLQCIANCRISHIACAACAGKLLGDECPGCDNGGVFEYTDYIEKCLVGLEIKCKNAGCNMSVSCLDFLDHERLCPHGLNIS